jgi:YjbE family integral membrane protein
VNLLDLGYDLTLVKAVLSIVMIDLVLSGDNAVVIGMAARRLPPGQQRQAMVLGAGGAVGLRVLFTAMAALLLDIPLLQAIGGLVLIWIAYKLLRDEAKEHTVREGNTLFEAVRTIVLADVIMSLDNILAVGGAAHGSLWLLIFGLMLSMPIILFGSRLVAALMNRLPWLVTVGSAVLAYTAAEMILKDPKISRLFPHEHWFTWPFVAVVTLGTIGLAFYRNRRDDPRLSPADEAGVASDGTGDLDEPTRPTPRATEGDLVGEAPRR